MLSTDNMEWTLSSIHSDILGILEKNFDTPEPKSPRFFGLNGLLDSRGLVYLVTILEEKYNIVFTPENMDEERFYTVDGIAEIIYLKLHSVTQ